MSVALVTVVSGEAYERFAKDMFASAFEFFGPDPVVAHIALPGREGWPDATLYRYHVLLEHGACLSGFDYVFLIDADMRFEAPVGEEVLGTRVATLHPGYVSAGLMEKDLPFERNTDSEAWCRNDTYYCGGFVGGTNLAMTALALRIRAGIECDTEIGITARWHDESHLNRYLAVNPPDVTLSPSYCMPDDASGYPWLSGMERKLVAVDKTPAERVGR